MIKGGYKKWKKKCMKEQKLGDGGRYIVTVRNVGYKMEVHND